MNADDRLASRLLAGRDQLSRIEKDELLDQLLTKPKRARWPWLAVPALAAVAIAVLLVLPRHDQPELAARGGAGTFAALHVTCSPACTAGGKLVFDLHGTTGYRYFAAFAQRADGTVLWYFPASVEVPATGVLDRSVILGPEHAPGTYRIFGVFSHAPLAQGAIRDAFDPVHMTAGPDNAVVTAEIEVR